MENLWKDLQFEKTVRNPIQDFEFTRRAYENFQQVVNLEEFEDQDAEVIFQYLYEKMELVSFGDYLRRYLYERFSFGRPFAQVSLDEYKDVIVRSFERTGTPKSMRPTSTKLRTMAGNWLTQASVKRESVFLLGFGLDMSLDTVREFLMKVQKEKDFDFSDAEEVIYWYCYKNHYSYDVAEKMKQRYQEIRPSGQEKRLEDGLEAVKNGQIHLDTQKGLWRYLHILKGGKGDSGRIAYEWFMRLLHESQNIIAGMYQRDVEEVRGKKVWKSEEISPGDVEKVIFNGVPMDQMGNLKKMSASILSRHFAQKRLSRQRIRQILNGKSPVERYDLITLEFFILSQRMENAKPKERYECFLREIRQILSECSMGEIYLVNPYESFILMCLLTDCPLAVFSEIWEMSYER